MLVVDPSLARTLGMWGYQIFEGRLHGLGATNLLLLLLLLLPVSEFWSFYT
jgi:hypothetical protein